MLNSLKPIKVLPARERVASALRKAILSQEMIEGEELTLDIIAEKLGVSATPVREAFQTLARDGLILLRPNKGAIVKGINERMVRDHYETRIMIESEIVRKVCLGNGKPDKIIAAYQRMDAGLSKGDYQSYINYDYDFHREIWNLCENAKMRNLADEVWNSLSFDHIDLARKFYVNSNKGHHEILEAIKNHDSELGVKCVKEHIVCCMEDIIARFTHKP